ncbi:LysM peptidoglycan-binding domain-containing protein [Aquimarina sp. AD10]|uniref:LysM peptidoglycan-binding domain-containing protein n=1 Tax=Aquimarina sp. AD10 TaxID=1714849 RepID=UPI000E509B3F|nr:LysM peptidoglycan-binding domain-containing protein [Aquimarina sp. AD10]AXT60397.1 LysM peptidoglycan-binding domain-containing protein [Aquimarina sp. AD10]RKN01168.1 LysM peptidoglycan-binding domain-containing protein [Aquimarina sp. AD10]
MPIVSFKKYPHVTLTTPPLKILRPKINNAYFAEAKIEDVEVTSTTKKKPEIYTVKSGDTLGKIATKKGVTIADIINSDTQITEANKNDITIGQKITLPTNVASKETKQKITFTKTNTGTIGSDLYVIVETEDFQGYNVSINIKQGKEKGIEEQDKAIMLKDDQGAYNTKVITAVGGMCDTEYTNKDDFADMAIFKIVIDSSDDTKKKAWTDALEKAKDKKTSLYILADAHTLDGQEEMNINYFGDTEEGEIRGEKITNRWLDVDGSWFEVKNGCKFPITPEQLLEIFPESTKNRREEVAKAINTYSDEFEIHNLDRMSHFLGQIGTETGQLKALQENYNYSAKNIYNTFLRNVLVDHPTKDDKYTFKYHDLIDGYDVTLECEYDNPTTSSQKRYGHKRDANDPIEVTRVLLNGKYVASWDYNSFKDLYTIKSSYTQSKTLFDYVYGCRMNNGKKSTEDGSDYFGVGFIHLTGKEKYKALDDKWKELYPNDPKDFMGDDISLLKTNVDVAIKASMIIWGHVQNGTNSKADQGNNDSAIKKVTKDVNGGYNGLAMRKQFTKKAYEVLD